MSDVTILFKGSLTSYLLLLGLMSLPLLIAFMAGLVEMDAVRVVLLVAAFALHVFLLLSFSEALGKQIVHQIEEGKVEIKIPERKLK